MMPKEGEEKQKVVVILSLTCIEENWNRIKWLSNEFKGGDELVILALCNHITPRSPLASAVRKFLGQKSKDDPEKVFGSTRKAVDAELKRGKKEDIRKNGAFVQLHKLFETEKKVKVSVEVETGPSRKVAAVRATKKLGATWVILDREMKRDKHYFMDRLSCRISSMKSNNSVVEIRGPINEHVSYNEMIPSYSLEDLSPSSQESPWGALRATPSREREQCSHSMPLAAGDIRKVASASSLLKLKNASVARFQHKGDTTRGTDNLVKLSVHCPNKSPATDGNEACAKRNNRANLGELLHIEPKGEGKDNGRMEVGFENSICSYCKNRRPKIGLQKDFTYAELYHATGGFSRRNFISEGGFGFVFEGKLKDGLRIAVKQHKPASLQGEKEFKSEVHLLSQARHQNLVMLLGSCSEESHRLLVYEYVCNGALEKHLSNDGVSSRPLSWEQRIKIALGAAKGLEFLHAHSIVHRDMRPSNILITHDHEALLGDFGLAKAHQDDTGQSSHSGVVGTLGYVAPEYAESGKMSTKTDVYSFGMVLLQLITGLKTTDAIPEGKSLVGWAKPLLERKNYHDLIDKRILDSHDVLQLFWMVRVAEDCLRIDPKKRCTMEVVVHNLNCIRSGNTNLIRQI